MSSKKQCYSGIGGQAVLEGIMMRNGNKCAVAVRKSDGTIEIKTVAYQNAMPQNGFTKLPFIRGVVNFIESMMLGIRSLNFSADLTMNEEDEEPSRFEKWLKHHFGEKANDIILTFTLIMAVGLAIGLFMVLPYALSALLGVWVHNKAVLSISEAVMRFLIFIGYVVLIGQLEDIKRLYMYHGAEHKCIDCIEKGRELTVHEVMRSGRLHPRCGTSFMLYVMAISCILFFFINASNPLLRLTYRLLLIPIIAGIAYELIRLAGRFDNVFTRVLSAPGMALQRLTTKEPTADMTEVAIKAVEAVYDWKAFIKEHYGYDFYEEGQDEAYDKEDFEDEYLEAYDLEESIEEYFDEDDIEEEENLLEEMLEEAGGAFEELLEEEKDDV